MAKIRVAKSFTLTHEDGEKSAFEPGEYDVSEKVSEHWFVKAHLDTEPEKESPKSAKDKADK